MAQVLNDQKYGFQRFGVCVPTRVPSKDILRWAQVAEQEGLDIFCVGEALMVHRTLHYRGVMPVVAAMAQATERINICIRITGPHFRHPALLAIDAAAVDEISGGRLILGLGTMTRPMLDLEYRTHLARSVAGMRECIRAVRGVISGEEFSYDAPLIDFHAQGTKLGFQPTRKTIPIYIGTSGENMFRLTGETADGLIITSSVAISPGFIRKAVSMVAEGANKAGRDLESIDVVTYPVVSISRDGDEARRSARAIVATRMARDHYGGFLDIHGISAERIDRIRGLVDSGNLEKAQSQITEEDVRSFCIAGTAEEVAKGLNSLDGLGVKTVCPMLYGSPDPEEAVRLFARQVVPHLRSGVEA